MIASETNALPPGTLLAVLQAGAMTLDLDSHTVAVLDQPVHLTRTEYKIFECLFRQKGHLVTREEIYKHVYGVAGRPIPKIISVIICNIKKKLAQSGAVDVIRSGWRKGYTLVEHSKEPTKQEVYCKIILRNQTGVTQL